VINRILVIVASALLLFWPVLPAAAHAPGDVKLEADLGAISLYDGEDRVELVFDDLFHGRIPGVKPLKCACAVCAYRAAKEGIAALWGRKTPHREDIEIVSALPTHGSLRMFQLVTGTAPEADTKTKGVFRLVLPDGTEVTDLSPENIRGLSQDLTADNYSFTIIRRSTGESFTITLNPEIFPEGYFAIRKKVCFAVPAPATSEEQREYDAAYARIRKDLATLPAWELFAEVEEPFPVAAVGFTGTLIALILVGAVHSWRAGRR